MRISTVRLALLLGLALVVGGWVDTYAPTPHGTTTIRPAAEDTRDGDLLTPGQIEALAMESPGTDPATCRAHVADTTWITCNDGTEISS